MSDLAPYQLANQMRNQWLEQGSKVMANADTTEAAIQVALGKKKNFFDDALMDCLMNLTKGPTYFMERNFCRMVTAGLETIPEGLAFDEKWLLSDQGWMWLDEPYPLPHPDEARLATLDTRIDFLKSISAIRKAVPKMQAVGWYKINPDTMMGDNRYVTGVVAKESVRRAGFHGVYFICYIHVPQHPTIDFYPWSYFTVNYETPVHERISKFEVDQIGGGYAAKDWPRHEMAWIYVAFHTMAQRLASIIQHRAPRADRRREAKAGRPEPPDTRVVYLRRMLQDKVSERAVDKVDWQWRWKVKPHWRNQFYPSENTHRWIMIDEYEKGPEDKPLKLQNVAYIAKR
jgi:hypothetical protein